MRLARWILPGIALAAGVAIQRGKSQWESERNAVRSQLLARRSNAPRRVFDSAGAAGLPLPVRRYLSAVLRQGQRAVAIARFAHDGEFNISETRERWAPFVSDQLTLVDRPGFDWDARIRMMPGVSVFVRDGYANGEGVLKASVAGVFTVAGMRGTPELAEGELMRFLAESVWYPTALLPGAGVTWQPLSESSARASLEDGSTSVSLDFSFDAAGLVASVRSAARWRTAGKTSVATPWEVRCSNYGEREGMAVPLNAEVRWLLPGGPFPYWRGRVVSAAYEWSPAAD